MNDYRKIFFKRNYVERTRNTSTKAALPLFQYKIQNTPKLWLLLNKPWKSLKTSDRMRDALTNFKFIN